MSLKSSLQTFGLESLYNHLSASQSYIHCRRFFHHIRKAIWNIGSVKSDTIDCIYIINLPRQKSRLNSILSHLSKCSIPFNIIDAVDGTTFEEKQQSQHAPDALIKLSKGQIACYLSHIKAWNAFIESGNQFAWILEDDSRIKYIYARKLDRLINELNKIDLSWDFIYTYRGEPRVLVYELNRLNLQSFIDKFQRQSDYAISKHFTLNAPCTCSAGYIISRNGAAKLIKLSKQITLPIDVQISLNQSELNMYALSNHLTYCQDDGLSDSRL